uniref:Uncharacterized protein n=1 Tax=Populus alba TaxID=43335 RepID=A0A4U5QRE2_POPAL|nr:hypothetical protein D5086_0000052650 [Populus alba]
MTGQSSTSIPFYAPALSFCSSSVSGFFLLVLGSPVRVPVSLFSCFWVSWSTASGSGGWLLKTVKAMVNAGSCLCAFVRWAEFASPLLLVSDSTTFCSKMEGQRQWWG